jgi:hypothetical protein
MLPRSLAVLLLHSGNAALAAAMADFVSLALRHATFAITSPVAGLSTCKRTQSDPKHQDHRVTAEMGCS